MGRTTLWSDSSEIMMQCSRLTAVKVSRCMHSKARSSSPGYFGNPCSNTCSRELQHSQPSQLGPNSSFYYVIFTGEKILCCRCSFLPRKWPFIHKTTLSVPTQLSWGIIPNYVPAGMLLVITQETQCFQLYGFRHKLAVSWNAAPFTQACPSLAPLWLICKFTPLDNNEK